MSEFTRRRLVILGGTGTLGQALVKEISATYSDVGEVLIVSRDEVKQLRMMETFPGAEYPFLKYLLGDVRDKSRLIEILKPGDLVVHAAAIKHVVIAENNPGECQKTNIDGTQNVVEACLEAKIEKALLISTDKAVNPIGVYGRSKQRAEEIFLQGKSDSLKFGVVRLGNILGSRGSVFEAFEKQKLSGLLRVTHEKATRFYISAEDAARFVLDKLILLEQGNINAPKMNSFRVIDLARSIAAGCEIEITGLRPGDKLHEELDGVSSADCVVNMFEVN